MNNGSPSGSGDQITSSPVSTDMLPNNIQNHFNIIQVSISLTGLSGNGHSLIQIDILNRIQQGNAILHRFLEGLAA